MAHSPSPRNRRRFLGAAVAGGVRVSGSAVERV